MFFNQANISQNISQSDLPQSSIFNQHGEEFDPELLINQSNQKNDSPIQELDLIDFQEENENQNEFQESFSPKSKKDDLNASMRSRTSHKSLQKQILQRYSRGNSPVRLVKNDSFFKDQGDFDLSQLGDFQQEEVNISQASFKKIDFNKEEHEFDKKQEQDQQKEGMFGLSKMIDEIQKQEEIKQEPQQILQIEVKKKQVQFAVEEEDFKESIILDKTIKAEIQEEQPKITQQITTQKPVEVWKNVQFTDSKSFLLSPVPEGKILQCHIQRESSGKSFFYPVYHLYISESNTYLMTVKRLAGQKTSKYLMTYNKDEISRKSKFFLGIIRSNFLGTEFMIYSKGENPKVTQEYSLLREQLGMIVYQSNFMLARCRYLTQNLQETAPRQFKVFLPAIINGVPLTYRPLMSREGLVIETQLKDKRDQTYHEFHNKLPSWDAKRNGYVLAFTERVNRTSVKNFQLTQFDKYGLLSQQSKIQFGRHSTQGFTLDIQYPFNPLQALATAITTFDTKIACD